MHNTLKTLTDCAMQEQQEGEKIACLTHVDALQILKTI